MTSPYRRACRQTNFSEGGFIRKVPFLFYYIFLFSLLLPFHLFIKLVIGQLGFYFTTQWKGDGVLGYLIAGSIY